MAPPLPKRRKQNVSHESGDEDVVPLPKPKPPSPAAKKDSRPPPVLRSSMSLQPKFANSWTKKPPSGGGGGESTSPEKPKLKPKGPYPVKTKPAEESKTSNLRMLFSRQAERPPTLAKKDVDDRISDPISEDDYVGARQVATTSRVGSSALKRFRDGTPTTAVQSVATSQRFLQPPRPTRLLQVENDQRPWSERFGPVNLDELAVHKRKVADVRRWLEDVMAGRLRQRLLLLKGAAGTGKTTTLRLLAQDMRCGLLEWKNPTPSSRPGQVFQSVSSQFEDFLGRGGRFGQLDTDIEDAVVQSQASCAGEDGRRIIVIEEFPNTFTRSSTALQSFRSAILSYLASNTPSLNTVGHQTTKHPITPVVMIISETLLTTTSPLADSLTVHRLLGPEITRHQGTSMIEFNAIAPTLLATALQRIVQKEARKSGRRRTPGPQVLKRLGEIGDIRSAISSLEFLCLKGDDETDWGSRIAFTRAKRGTKDGTILTRGEKESLQLVSQREASLGIFHAVGKVMYNKRDEVAMGSDTPEGLAETLPAYLAHKSRPRRSEVSVDSLIDETGTDTNTFISALHENYVLSCAPTGPADASSSIDYINDCLEYLSDSDILFPSSDIFFGGRGLGASGVSGRDSASHLLRQDEISYQVAARGLLFSLPNPVKRIASKGGSKTGRAGGGDAFKMFYPTSIKLWREKEEVESAVDEWSTRLLRGEDAGRNVTDGASAFRKVKTNDGRDQISRLPSKPPVTEPKPAEKAAMPPLLTLGSSARRELLLERLPYMAHIARRRNTYLGLHISAHELEKVVSFTGIDGAADDEADEGEEEAIALGCEAWATDKPTEEGSPRKKAAGIRHKSDDGAVLAALPAQRLVLSDDDIEDD